MEPNNLHTKFSAFNVDFSSVSPDPLGSRRPSRRASNKGTTLKSGYFTSVDMSSVNS